MTPHLTQAAALVEVLLRHALAVDTEVVEAGLDAVVRAAADGDLELVRQSDVVPADEELVVDPLGKGLGVKEAVDADGALAGHDGAYDGAGAAGDEARGLHLGDQGLEVLVGDALDLNGQADRERNAPVAVLARDVGHHLHLLIRENAVGRDYAGYKVLTVVGENEAAALEGLLFGFGDFQQIHRLHIFINIDIVTQPRLPVKSKLPRRLS